MNFQSAPRHPALTISNGVQAGRLKRARAPSFPPQTIFSPHFNHIKGLIDHVRVVAGLHQFRQDWHCSDVMVRPKTSKAGPLLAPIFERCLSSFSNSVVVVQKFVQ